MAAIDGNSQILDLWTRYHLFDRTIEHFAIFGVAFIVAAVIGLCIGLLLYRRQAASTLTFGGLSVLEMVPDLALLALLIPVVGIGTVPTILACIGYSVLPVARNTYAGLIHVSATHLDVGAGIGLDEQETLFLVRFPLALPLIVGGCRIAVVFCMGTVTLGGLIGAGGLGGPLQTGIATNNQPLLLLTGIWIGVLAVLLDGFAGTVEGWVSRRYGLWSS